MVVDEGLGQVLVCVADRIPAVPEAVALHDSLDVDESVLPDRVEPDGVDMVPPGKPAECGVFPDAPEDARVDDAPRLPVPPLVQLDRDRAVQEHDHVRSRVAVLLGLLDGDLAERAEDVPEVGGQVVEHLCLDVRALDLGG